MSLRCFIFSLIHALQVSNLTAEFEKERERLIMGVQGVIPCSFPRLSCQDYMSQFNLSRKLAWKFPKGNQNVPTDDHPDVMWGGVGGGQLPSCLL